MPVQSVQMAVEARPIRGSKTLEMNTGVCYLVKEKKPDLSFRLLEMMTSEKKPGLVVTRRHPSKLRKERGLGDVRVVWLSHTPGEDFHNPTALGGLTKLVCKFIEDNGECVVLLDGLEYIIINNGFIQTLLFVEHVNEFVMQRRAIVIIPVSPETLEEKELALLERNLEVIESPLVKMGLEMEEVSRLIDAY